MMTSKQILDSKITLYLVVGVLAFCMIQSYRANLELKKENKALQEANRIQDNHFEELKAANQVEIDSLKIAIGHHNKFLADLSVSYSDLEEKYNDILNSIPDEETDIRNITDVDSLQREIAGHYRR